MCPNCQAQVRSDADFCPNCGTALKSQPPAGSTPPGYVQQPPGSTPPGYVQPAGGHTPAFRFDVSRLDVADRVIGAASVIVFISLFLPWFGVLGFTVSGMSYHGYLAISLIAAVVLIGYLVLRAGWQKLPFRLPIAHAPLLLVGTAVQLLFVLIAFLFKPSGTSWEVGAYLGLLAALAACAVIAVPAIRSMQGTQR
ncbi:MAG TPA: zinc ribbon domain-containing protein [Streptosporangiaceae bacterium]|nr:zinc ribbon domain-containing protein [Streptosporangiaceae bacterium]